MHFTVKFKRAGGHADVTVFAGKAANMAVGDCGSICMTIEEAEAFFHVLQGGATTANTVKLECDKEVFV